MNSRKHIQEELQALGSGLPLPGVPVQQVPDGYFDRFAASVLARIRASEESATAELEALSPLLAGLSKQPPFHVPSGYFDGLQAEAPAWIAGDSLPASLAALDRRMPNAVPAGYFEGLSDSVLSRVADSGAKVVPMRRAWMRMAAAAVVAGLMAVGGFAYFGGNSSGTAAPTTAWVEKGLKNVSDESLDEFIETADAVHENEIAQTPVHKAEVRTMMKDVSDNEMDAFLAQVPTDDEELLIIN